MRERRLRKMAKESKKIPLGLKILVGFLGFVFVFAIKNFQVMINEGWVLGFKVGLPWSVFSNLISLILVYIVPIMSVFNRKLLFWKLSLGYMMYSLVSGVVLLVKELFVPSETHVFMLILFAVGVVYIGLLAWYYYSKKSYFNKK